MCGSCGDHGVTLRGNGPVVLVITVLHLEGMGAVVVVITVLLLVGMGAVAFASLGVGTVLFV